MANAKEIKILKQGTKAWNEKRYHMYPGEDWKQPDLEGADLKERNLDGVNFKLVNLCKANLQGATLVGAQLAGANLNDADLQGADLTRTVIGMTSREFGLSLDQSFSQGSSWRYIIRAQMAKAGLRRARLEGAKLNEAILSGVDLTEAQLIGANLSKADLREANLARVEFKNANLVQASLAQATLTECDFTSALVGWTTFSGRGFEHVKGLESVSHVGPSSIGIDFLFSSTPKIPKNFLRGAGIPELIMEVVDKILPGSMQFQTCFISYSAADEKFASLLHERLQENGVRCWFAPHDIKSGEKIIEQIDRAIQSQDRLLLILSSDSMSSSWVGTEIGKALQKEEIQKRRVLFPIGLVPYSHIKDWQLFDADRGSDSAKEIREYFIPDFSQWEDEDVFSSSFARLLVDLSKDEAGGKS